MNLLCALLFSLNILGWSHELPSINRWKVNHRNIYVAGLIPAGHANEIEGRVIGGHEATPNAFPYMVAVLIDSKLFCGGSLIARNWVLTAAHCTEGGSHAIVILGAHRPLQSEVTQIAVNSTKLITHPSWDITRLMHDIALIQLPAEIPLNSAIQTIAIAPADSGSFAGKTGVLTGWGYTSDTNPSLSDTLQQVNLRLMSTAECMEYAGVIAHETNICSSGFNGTENVGSCFGDSGSPIVVDGVQVGVVSFGSGQCSSGSITSYARVSSYANWIESQMNGKS